MRSGGERGKLRDAALGGVKLLRLRGAMRAVGCCVCWSVRMHRQGLMSCLLGLLSLLSLSPVRFCSGCLAWA